METRIAQITDLHLDESYPKGHQTEGRKRFLQIINDIKKEQISSIICTGDIGESESVPYFFKQLEPFSLAVSLGNHDSFDVVSKHFNRSVHPTIRKLDYTTETKFHKFIFLDSSEGKIKKQQLDWLKKELQSSKDVVLFTHHPIIGLNLKVDEIGALENRDEVQLILINHYKKISIFCGHYHMENILIHKNIKQMITPSVSFQIIEHPNKILTNTNEFGYRILEIDQRSITSKVKMIKNAN